MRPHERPSVPPLRLLALLGAGVAVLVFARAQEPAQAEGRAQPRGESPSAAAADPPKGGGGEHVGPTLSAREACLDVGYLCAPLAEADSMRVLRWPEGTRVLRVHVPLPPHEPASIAHELRAHAVLGIRSWDGTPVPVEVTPDGVPADIRVEWRQELPDGRLGEVRTEWRESAGEVHFAVTRFVLVSRDTHRPESVLDARSVQLTAMHEMGHALGLPHSDLESDVMYPEKTARYLSARDYRTVQALYRAPNGALILR